MFIIYGLGVAGKIIGVWGWVQKSLGGYESLKGVAGWVIKVFKMFSGFLNSTDLANFKFSMVSIFMCGAVSFVD